jgi:heme-degrading monooxygenase HmoA
VPHLAQINIAQLRYPAGDPRVAEFVDNVARLNGVAERMPGFVWRHEDQSDPSQARRLFGDPLMTFTLSLWESTEALENFVWNTVHKRFFDKRSDWFTKPNRPGMALWWHEGDQRPSPEEGARRLAHLAAHGNSEEAFDWAFVTDAPLSPSRRYG